MSKNINDKELKQLQVDVKTLNELNQQVTNYTKAQYKACQLAEQAEEKLQKFYDKLNKKYNKEGKAMSVNTQNGELTFQEIEE